MIKSELSKAEGFLEDVIRNERLTLKGLKHLTWVLGLLIVEGKGLVKDKPHRAKRGGER